MSNLSNPSRWPPIKKLPALINSENKNANKNLSEMNIQNTQNISTPAPPKSSPSSNNIASNTVSIKTPPNDTIAVSESVEKTTNNNNNVVKTEKIRNIYVIAPMKGVEKSFLTLAEDNQLVILKTNPSQQVYTANFHMLVNVKYDTTKDPSACKIMRAGNILKGKTFPLDMKNLETRIEAYKIKLEGVGKNAPDMSDTELKQVKESSLIEKLTVKVTWISTHIFSDHRSVKVLTKKGLPLLISLGPNHHNILKKDEVFTFINITKTENWPSTNPFFKEVDMKFKTTMETSVIHVPLPSQAFLQLGKMVARVLGIDQKLFIFDQCEACFKSKYNNTCGQESCTEYGIKKPANSTFVTSMVIDNEDNPDDMAETVKIWNNHLIDFPFSKLVPESDFENAIILEDLEKHYKDKLITYKVKNGNGQWNGDFKTITNVTLKPSDMDID